MQRNRGMLIVFEGIDGSGKTTQIEYLLKYLQKENIPTTAVSYADQRWFREAFAKRSATSDAHEEIRFFAWAYNKLVRKCIIPLLREGKVVLADRYSPSYFAYQSFHGIDQETLASNLTPHAPTPALLIILDVSLKTALTRSKNRESQTGISSCTPFSLTATARLEHAAAYYKYHSPAGALIINGELSIIELAEQIWFATKQLLNIS